MFGVLFSVDRRVPGSVTGWSSKHGEAQMGSRISSVSIRSSVIQEHTQNYPPTNRGAVLLLGFANVLGTSAAKGQK